MCIRRETREKARRSLAFSRVSKPHTHITHMLRQCTRIVYDSSLKLCTFNVCLYDVRFTTAPTQSVIVVNRKDTRTTNFTIYDPLGNGGLELLQEITKNYMRQVGGCLRIIRFPPPIKLTATI